MMNAFYFTDAVIALLLVTLINRIGRLHTGRRSMLTIPRDVCLRHAERSADLFRGRDA